MITLKDVHSVVNAVVPLYVSMFLAYASVRWWKIFNQEQCAGINRFVAIFAVPLLSFEFISRVNPFKMNSLFIAADSLLKFLVLLLLLSWTKFSRNGNFDWCITIFAVTTLPNTLVMGIPLIKSMYGDDQEGLMIQVVVLQSLIWYTLLLFLFEYRSARNNLIVQISKAEEKSNTTASSVGVLQNSDEDVVVHVVIARPSLEMELQRTQTYNKVAPESGEVTPDVDEDAEELHKSVWKCRCCNCEGVSGLCKQSVQACSGEQKIESINEEHEKNMNAADQSCSRSSSLDFVKLILKMVLSKLIRNPNSYSSLLGLIWALASCRWNLKMPVVIENSITILSNAGLGMAMFSLGLFMALQPKIIACGKRVAFYGTLMRFAAGPAAMAAASAAVGIRGTVLKVSIIQAALPQGIVPFVFAREYNLHPEVLSTAVIFGMIVSLPITVLYYVLLDI